MMNLSKTHSNDKTYQEKIKKLVEGHINELPDNYFPNKIAHKLNSWIRLIIIIFLSYKLGFLYGIGVSYIIFFTFRYMIQIIFKLESTSYQDLLFINQKTLYNMNICGCFDIEHFDKIELRREFEDKLFNNVPKLHASLTHFLADYYWNTPQVKNFTELEKKEIMRHRIIDVEKKNSKDCLKDYIEKQVNTVMNPFISPIEFHLIEYKDNNTDTKQKHGNLFLKIDHCFSDGLGLVVLFGLLEKNYSMDKYPKILRHKVNNFLYYLQVFLFDITRVFITVIPLVILNVIKSLMQEKKRFIPYVEANKLYPNKSGVCIISDVLTVEFKKLKAVSKMHKISINDIYIYSLLRALKEYSPESDSIQTLIPVGMSNMPKHIKDVELYNKVAFLFELYDLPKINNKKDNNKYKSIDIMSDMYKVRFIEVLYKFLREILDHKTIQNLHKERGDITISNLPAREKHLKIGKCLVTNVHSLSSCSSMNSFALATTYCEHINFQLSFDINMNVNPNYVLNTMKNIFDEMIQSLEENHNGNSLNNKKTN